MNIFLFFILLIVHGNSDSLRPKLNEYLSPLLKDYSRFEFDIMAEPQGNFKDVVIDYQKQVIFKGNMAYVPVLILKGGGERTQTLLSIKLRLYKSVPVALRDISKGEILNPANFETRETDIAGCRANIFEDIAKVKSYQTRTRILKDEILLTNMLEKIPLIKKGDSITALVIKGGVRIDVDATARQDGSENEIISILTSDKKTFKARVIDQFSALIVE